MKTLHERVNYYAFLAGSKAKTRNGKIRAALAYVTTSPVCLVTERRRALASPSSPWSARTTRRNEWTDEERLERRARVDPQARRKLAGIKAARTRAANAKASNEAVAIRVAQGVHDNCKSLYRSGRAWVEYGTEPTDSIDWDAYSKSYKYPARWKNAAVMRSMNCGTVWCYPVTGATVTVKTPKNLKLSDLAPLGSLVDGDAYAIMADGYATRYDTKGQRTGVAVRIGNDGLWEHGDTLAGCRRESERKEAIRALEAKRGKLTQEQKQRVQRAKRWILRLCPNLPVTRADARRIGYCKAGIRGFKKRYGIGDNSTIQALLLTDNLSAQALARRVAEDKAMELILATHSIKPLKS